MRLKHRHLSGLVFLIGILIFQSEVRAYPEFIGYGYSSCLTCHFNGHGSGPLNDYGRALWSAEISSRAWASKSTTDEMLGEKSGFLGSSEALPWWLRPSLKYRGLWNKTALGSPQTQEKFYHMQADLGSVLLLDQDQKNIFVVTYGFFPLTAADSQNGKINRFLAKDLYLRSQIGEQIWIYVGLQDKVFGIRNVDHTSFSRRPQKVTLKNDQSVGLTSHWVAEEFELSAQVFVGNPQEAQDIQMKGGSLKYEKKLSEKNQMGFSALSQKNTSQQLDMTAIEYRSGYQTGSALLGEFGFLTKTESAAKKTGSWLLLGTQNQIDRGYFMRFFIERFNEEFRSSSPDQWRWNLGLMAFPLPRMELRLDLWHLRPLQNYGASEDQWAAQGQIHVSL
jgi:hypothetical protein